MYMGTNKPALVHPSFLRTSNHLAPKGLVAQLVEHHFGNVSVWVWFPLSPEIFFSQKENLGTWLEYIQVLYIGTPECFVISTRIKLICYTISIASTIHNIIIAPTQFIILNHLVCSRVPLLYYMYWAWAAACFTTHLVTISIAIIILVLEYSIRNCAISYIISFVMWS